LTAGTGGSSPASSAPLLRSAGLTMLKFPT
jgi:hypothetical protein